MLESAIVCFVSSAVLTAVAFHLGQRFPRANRTPIVVEEFKLEEVEQDGFKKLIVKFQDAKNRIHPFEFHPAYAHMFSDELVKHAARALAPKQ